MLSKFVSVIKSEVRVALGSSDPFLEIFEVPTSDTTVYLEIFTTVSRNHRTFHHKELKPLIGIAEAYHRPYSVQYDYTQMALKFVIN